MLFHSELNLPDGSLVRILVPGVAALCMSYFIHRTRRWHVKFTADSGTGVQSVHQGSVPRVGGASLAFGLVAYFFIGFFLEVTSPQLKAFYWTILFSLIFYFIGLCEDIIHGIRPIIRLVALTGSAIFVWLSGEFEISRIGVVVLDYLIDLPIAPAVVTILCLVATVNAVNMVDGLNGLAGGIVGSTLAAFAYIAFTSEDYYLVSFILSTLIIVACFLVFNWPLGLLFLGDGGAYLLGSLSCLVGILLANRNDDVSYITILLCMLYLAFEITGAVIRRIVSNRPLLFADDGHLHSILVKKLNSKNTPSRPSKKINNLISLGLVTTNAIYLVCLLNILY